MLSQILWKEPGNSFTYHQQVETDIQQYTFTYHQQVVTDIEQFRFCFLLLFELNRIYFNCRTLFRPQFEFCGLSSTLTWHTFGSSLRLTGHDRAILPRIVDIFVLEHLYAVVTARAERHSERRRVSDIHSSYVFTVPP